MMYSNTYGLRCIIKLNKYFDFYNDIIPLCVELKIIIKYIKERNILVIFSKCFENRFYNRSVYKIFIESIQKNNCNNNDQDILIWKDILNYTLNYKYNNQYEKYINEDFHYINDRFLEIENGYNFSKIPDDISAEYEELFPVIEYYNIVSNKDRFEKIKELENELVNIELNNDEKEILNFIRNYPPFKDSIEYIDNEIYIK
jgi:hypothetical protein